MRRPKIWDNAGISYYMSKLMEASGPDEELFT